MISRGKVEQVYSFKEPPYVPIVYIFNHEIFECFFHFNFENCQKKSPHSEFNNLKHYMLFSKKSVMFHVKLSLN